MTVTPPASGSSIGRLTSSSSTLITREHGHGETVICAPLFLGTANGGDHRGEQYVESSHTPTGYVIMQ
jgi:hypothetical protein